MTRHHTFFPLLVVLLTAVLAVTVVWTFRQKENTALPVSSATSSVSIAVYRRDFLSLSSEFARRFPTRTSEQEKAEELLQIRDALLSMTVPAVYKDLHLDLVIAANEWIKGLEGKNLQKQAAAQTHWNERLSQTPWLKNSP